MSRTTALCLHPYQCHHLCGHSSPKMEQHVFSFKPMQQLILLPGTTYTLSFSIPSKIKISMQFDVLQLLRNALPSHFWKHLVACFVCIFISMRKDLRHPYMCSPLPDISYAFLYSSPGYKHSFVSWKWICQHLLGHGTPGGGLFWGKGLIFMYIARVWRAGKNHIT